MARSNVSQAVSGRDVFVWFNGLPQNAPERKEVGDILSADGLDKAKDLYRAAIATGSTGAPTPENAVEYTVLVLFGDGTYKVLGSAMSTGRGRARLDSEIRKLRDLAETHIAAREMSDGVTGQVLSLPSSEFSLGKGEASDAE